MQTRRPQLPKEAPVSVRFSVDTVPVAWRSRAASAAGSVGLRMSCRNFEIAAILAKLSAPRDGQAGFRRHASHAPGVVLEDQLRQVNELRFVRAAPRGLELAYLDMSTENLPPCGAAKPEESARRAIAAWSPLELLFRR